MVWKEEFLSATGRLRRPGTIYLFSGFVWREISEVLLPDPKPAHLAAIFGFEKCCLLL